MCRKIRLLPLFATATLVSLALSTPARASVLADGAPGVGLISLNDGAFVDGYSTENSAYPSTFSVNFLVIDQSGAGTSAPRLFSEVPYTYVGAVPYFVFTYDLQESGGRNSEFVSIDTFSISAGGKTVWSLAQPIWFNGYLQDAAIRLATSLSLKPLGNGDDLALYVPVSRFQGLGLTGSSQLAVSSSQSYYDNGGDEWTFTDFGIPTVVRRLNSNDPLPDPLPQPEPVPDPSPALMLLSGAAVLTLLSRGRRRSRG